MLADSQRSKEMHDFQLERITQEKERLFKDNEIVEASFRDLRKRYEEMRTINDTYKRVKSRFVCDHYPPKENHFKLIHKIYNLF